MGVWPGVPQPREPNTQAAKTNTNSSKTAKGQKKFFIPSISVCLLSSFWLVGPVDDQRHRNLEPSVWPVLCRVPPQCTTTTFVEGRSFCRYCRCQDLTSFHHQISLAGPGGRGPGRPTGSVVGTAVTASTRRALLGVVARAHPRPSASPVCHSETAPRGAVRI